MKKNSLVYSFFLLLIVSTFACTRNTQQINFAENSSELATPTKKPDYRLGFGDVLDIRFFNNRNYNISVPVRPDGNITIEKIGDVYVDGKTPAYVDSVITAAFSKFLREPEVTVIVMEFGNNHFYVLGEVETPGRYAIAKELTAFQAVAMAGGTKADAKMSHALLIRRAETASPLIMPVNLKKLEDKENAAAIFLDLKPNDIIFIPNTRISDFAGFMSNVYSTILPPVDSYLRAVFWSRL
ncbi:MAG: hypothetical protein DWQ10_08115 [Calditrichaeota bacterium]|nr:MAG: hypothetical protein DWQ10_08115 [Calditrichota bacterium]